MNQFLYSAYQTDGHRVDGTVEAADRIDAMRRLEEERLSPVRLEEVENREPRHPSPGGEPVGPALTGNQVLLFADELGDLVRGGIPLEPALGILSRRTEVSALREVAERVRLRLREGDSLSAALRATSTSFGEMFCSLVAAGEQSGELGGVLQRQARYLRSMQDLRNRVLSALVYPASLVVSAAGVVALFVGFLLPQLTELLDATGGTLPAGAQVLFALTQWAAHTWWIVLLAAGGMASAALWWGRREENFVDRDRLRWRLPLLGGLTRDRFYVQFLETLSNVLGNGLPLKSALELTRRASANHYLRARLREVVDDVADGAPLSESLQRTGEFPALLIDLVVVGEEIGDLPTALARAGERYDRELTRRSDRLGNLIQPVVILLLAALIGLLAYLMITAIFHTISGLG